jgi:hypothetical protein
VLHWNSIFDYNVIQKEDLNSNFLSISWNVKSVFIKAKLTIPYSAVISFFQAWVWNTDCQFAFRKDCEMDGGSWVSFISFHRSYILIYFICLIFWYLSYVLYFDICHMSYILISFICLIFWYLSYVLYFDIFHLSYILISTLCFVHTCFVLSMSFLPVLPLIWERDLRNIYRWKDRQTY